MLVGLEDAGSANEIAPSPQNFAGVLSALHREVSPDVSLNDSSSAKITTAGEILIRSR
jgi:hypothetical protein